MIIVSRVTAPPEEPGTPVAPPPPMTWTWTAPWLNRSWTLTAHGSPVRKLAGAIGVGAADPTHWWADSATVDGSSWDGMRTERAEFFMPVLIEGATTAAFLANHAAFVASLDPGREGVLRITRPDARWREISLRYQSGGEQTADLDVVRSRFTTYGITWVKPDPFWRGAPITATFPYASLSATFLPGPPFTLTPSDSTASATVTNPGDVESYAVWRINGPFTGFSVGVGTSLVQATLTKAAGEWVEIDMTPRMLTIVDEDGADRWNSVTAVDFAAIPPGATTLTTALVGAGAGAGVSLTFTPRYRRAW